MSEINGEFRKGWVSGSDNDDYATPQALFDRLNAEYHFTLDPCSSDKNHKCPLYYTVHDDGLSKSWGGQRVYMNPPYKGIYPWVQKAASHEAEIVVALLPARTETKWFHDFIYQKPNVRVWFLRHRLKYNDGKTAAPFGSMIVEFRNDNWEK